MECAQVPFAPPLRLERPGKFVFEGPITEIERNTKLLHSRRPTINSARSTVLDRSNQGLGIEGRVTYQCPEKWSELHQVAS
jgi:hypothetical protein